MNDPSEILLLPAPRKMRRLPGVCTGSFIRSIVDSTAVPPRGYRLNISPAGVQIVAHDPAAQFYAAQTLAQLRRQFSRNLPCLEIEDSPDFPVRGVMLDISRDKIPTMQTLFDLVDRLAEWKINQLQLYIEHTFAYRGHEEVWKDASPMTADEIRALDAYCRDRFIELVPNQNSFGHMERWLKHARYLPLAEAPDGAQTPWGYRWEGPFSLCPTDPRTMELLGDLYGQLLPNFSSRLFNVGCDETFDIGQGRSKAECEKRGVGEVYLDFLLRVRDLAAGHGRRIMFWGDIIKDHPELVPRLPRDAVAMCWGYEADHPFDEEAKQFAQSGVPFYVCPGTSSWCSIAGRTRNMLENQKHAAEAGLRHGAIGFLNTDWGDYGHLQYLPVSYAGLAAGAAMSWCEQSNRDVPLDRLLDMHVFEDSAGVIGRVACDLGNVYTVAGKLVKNRSSLFSILVPSSTHANPMDGITPEGMAAAESAIEQAIRPLDSARMRRGDAGIVLDEFKAAATMLKHACRPARQSLDVSGIKAEEFLKELESIRADHSRLWLARNRPGGLNDSLRRLSAS